MKHKFVGDVTSNIIEGFYDYNSTTHVVTAAETKLLSSPTQMMRLLSLEQQTLHYCR